jgi:hypothetical protein
VSDRKAFLLRIDQDVLDAIQRWANDDLRSVNGQIEFLLRRALQESKRAVAPRAAGGSPRRRPAGNDQDR